MSTFEINILDRIKIAEHKISLLENENKKLKIIAEAVTTATTTTQAPTSTVKTVKDYRASIGINQPLNRPSSIRLRSSAGSFGDNQGIDQTGNVGAVTSSDPGSFTGSLSGRPSVSSGSPINTQIPTGGNTTPIPDNFDINGDGVVDGSDLGWILSNWNNFPPAEQGALLGRFLSAYGTNSQGGGQESPFVQRKSGTTTSDIASLSSRKYVSYT